MKIKSVTNYHLDGHDQLQRSMVKLDCGARARRVVALVEQDGSLSCVLSSPQWQVQIHNGEYHNIFGSEAERWETALQAL